MENLEGVSRDMIEYLDLEWDENCLEFHRTVRPVGADHELPLDLRQPLYTRSVGHWRHYEAYIEELRAAIGDRQAQ